MHSKIVSKVAVDRAFHEAVSHPALICCTTCGPFGAYPAVVLPPSFSQASCIQSRTGTRQDYRRPELYNATQVKKPRALLTDECAR